MKHITETDLNGIPIVAGQAVGDGLQWNGANWIKFGVISNVLTGFSAAAGTVSASDTILTSINKIVGNINSLATWNLNGNTVVSEKWIGTVDNFALPFRTNNVEVGRFSATGNFGVGMSPSATAKVQIKSIGNTSGTSSILVTNTSLTNVFNVTDTGMAYFDGGLSFRGLTRFLYGNNDISGGDPRAQLAIYNSLSAVAVTVTLLSDTKFGFFSNGFGAYGFVQDLSNNFIGLSENSPSARLHVQGSTSTSATFGLKVQNSAGAVSLQVRDDGNVSIGNTANLGALDVAGAGTYTTVISSASGGHSALYINANGGAKGIYINSPSSGDPCVQISSVNKSILINSSSAGDIIDVQPTGAGSTGINVSSNGANSYGLRVNNAGASSVGGYFTGALYSLIVPDSYGNIGFGTTTPETSALLDLQSTTRGFKIMRMTATQASAITAVDGLMLYVTDTNGTFTAIGFWGRENGAWVKL